MGGGTGSGGDRAASPVPSATPNVDALVALIHAVHDRECETCHGSGEEMVWNPTVQGNVEFVPCRDCSGRDITDSPVAS